MAIKYVDLDSSTLVHWKYIKREKLSNGKYRYYYHDDNYTDSRNKLAEASKAHEELKDRYKSYNRFIDYYQAQLDEKNGGNTRLTDENENLKGWKKMRDDVAEEKRETYRALKRAKEQYERAEKEYSKSPGHKVADVLNSASDTIDKAKKYVSKLFWKVKRGD